VWIYKRQHQPLAQRSAGCVFRNPEGHSAGQLVDQAGCKGLVCGAATVSTLHANFIIAETDCTSADVRTLIQMVRDRVFDRFGLWLQTEIEIWPYQPSSEIEHKRSCA
jgi:UDP-N-acetylmuramate dehydrogenase